MNIVVALLSNPTNAWRESLLLSTFDCTYSVVDTNTSPLPVGVLLRVYRYLS